MPVTEGLQLRVIVNGHNQVVCQRYHARDGWETLATFNNDVEGKEFALKFFTKETEEYEYNNRGKVVLETLKEYPPKR